MQSTLRIREMRGDFQIPTRKWEDSKQLVRDLDSGLEVEHNGCTDSGPRLRTLTIVGYLTSPGNGLQCTFDCLMKIGIQFFFRLWSWH